jgi:hypothetical protein
MARTRQPPKTPTVTGVTPAADGVPRESSIIGVLFSPPPTTSMSSGLLPLLLLIVPLLWLSAGHRATKHK